MTPYIVVRSDEYLAHHGIKGQKHGVRRWQNEDGSLTPAGYEHYGVNQGGNKKLDRLYKKEMKRFNKLADRTDVEKQTANAAKYNKRAKIGAGIAIGAAGVAAGANPVKTALDLASKRKIDNLKSVVSSANDQAMDDAGKNIENMFNIYKKNGMSTDDKSYRQYVNSESEYAMNKIRSNNEQLNIAKGNAKWEANERAHVTDITRKVALGVAGVSAGYAAYNKIQAHLAKKRTTEIGHDKAVQKAKAQVERMQKMFANTPYADLVKDASKSIKHAELWLGVAFAM